MGQPLLVLSQPQFLLFNRTPVSAIYPDVSEEGYMPLMVLCEYVIVVHNVDQWLKHVGKREERGCGGEEER
jgi:hypothetical protein